MSISKILRAAAAIILILGLGSRGYALEEPELCHKIELERIEEMYDLLNRFARDLWPGWGNYPDIEFQFMFPNQSSLIVNPKGDLPEGWSAVEGVTVLGKKVYIDNRNSIPLKMKPPLGKGGNARIGQVYINLEPLENIPPAQAFDRENFVRLQEAQSEVQILTYVHELFHEYQNIVWTDRIEELKMWQAAKEKRPGAPKKTSEPKRMNRENIPPVFLTTLPYAVYKDIEGRALLSAFRETNMDEAITYLKEAFAARKIRHGGMSPEDVTAEAQLAVGEGTAQYVQVNMARLIAAANYRSRRKQRVDPYFFNYGFMDDYVRYWAIQHVEEDREVTEDSRVFCYTFGALYCFLLDRFQPGWKQGFLENSRTLDDVVGRLLQWDDRRTEEIGARLKVRYPIDGILAKHGPVIKERDDSITLVENRKGKRFVVDWTPTNVLFPTIVPRGPWTKLSFRRIFPQGIETMTFGEVMFTGRATPMDKYWIFNIEWVDTETPPEKQGYTLTYASQEGRVYRDAVVTTGGFVLKAPEIMIEERDGRTWIEILSLVGRGKGPRFLIQEN